MYYWLTERLYNELAWFYDTSSWLVSLGHWDAWRKCALDYLAGSETLEIGFGTGELLLEMARRDHHVTGLEPSGAMQRIARKKLHRSGFVVPRVLSIAQHTPFVSSSFDSIISTFPAGYIFDPDVWREVARLLRNKGSSLPSSNSRFIVVGLFITFTGKLHQLPGAAPFNQNSYGYILPRIQQLAESAGLDLRMEIRSFPGYELPILIAEKSR